MINTLFCPVCNSQLSIKEGTTIVNCRKCGNSEETYELVVRAGINFSYPTCSLNDNSERRLINKYTSYRVFPGINTVHIFSTGGLLFKSTGTEDVTINVDRDYLIKLKSDSVIVDSLIRIPDKSGYHYDTSRKTNSNLCKVTFVDGKIILCIVKLARNSVLTYPEHVKNYASTVPDFGGWGGPHDGSIITKDVKIYLEHLSFSCYNSINKSNGAASVFNIRFMDRGKELSSSIVAFGDSITPPEISKTHTTADGTKLFFLRWEDYHFGMRATSDRTFTSVYRREDGSEVHYRKISFTVNNEEYQTMIIPDGTMILPPSNPDKHMMDFLDIEFSHWGGFSKGMRVTEDAIFPAVFTRKRYAIRFIDRGEELQTTILRSGEEIQPPRDPVGFTSNDGRKIYFSGWNNYNEGMVATADTTFEATYVDSNGLPIHFCKVKFVVRGEKYELNYQIEGAKLQPPKKDPPSYSEDSKTMIFSHWNGLYKNTVVADGYVFTARFIPKEEDTPLGKSNDCCTIIFRNRGKIVQKTTLKIGDVIVAPNKNYAYKRDNGTWIYFSRWDGHHRGMKASSDMEFESVFVNSSGDEVRYRNIRFTVEGEDYLQYYSPDGTVIKSPRENPVIENDGGCVKKFIRWDGFDIGMVVSKDCIFPALFAEDYSEPISHGSSSSAITEEINDKPLVVTILFIDRGLQYESISMNLGDVISPPKNPGPYFLKNGTIIRFKRWVGYTEGMRATSNDVFESVFEDSKGNEVRYRKISFTVNGKDYQTHHLADGSVIEAPVLNPTDEGKGPSSKTFSHWRGFYPGMIVNSSCVFPAVFQTKTAVRDSKKDDSSLITPDANVTKSDKRSSSNKVSNSTNRKTATKGNVGFALDPEKIRKSREELKVAIELLDTDELETDDSMSIEVCGRELTDVSAPKNDDSSDDKWMMLINSLSRKHVDYLRSLLGMGGFDSSETMLNVLEDEINSISEDCCGDILIEDGRIIEEYMEDIRRGLTDGE